MKPTRWDWGSLRHVPTRQSAVLNGDMTGINDNIDNNDDDYDIDDYIDGDDETYD